jgi:L-rhamnose-H+ transport protein
MEQAAAIGFLVIIVGGIMEGVFSLPLKFTPKWAWENIWGAGSLMALLLVPWPLALLTIPDLVNVYSSVNTSTLLLVIIFGAGWGTGGIFFGLGLASVGISIGLSLIMGLIAIGGSVIPLAMQHPEQFGKPAGLVLISGILLMIVGLLVCARAGKIRSAEVTSTRGNSFRVGLVYCVAAGLLSALVNFGLIFGSPIAESAIRNGAAQSDANNAIWALVFTSNYLVNVGYCIYLAWKNGTANRFMNGAPRYWLLAMVMGLLWAGGIVVYGIGATRIGQFGAYLGFPVMLISSILAGNVAGAITGEWSSASSHAKRIMGAGVAVLAIAIFVLSYSNQLISIKE